MKRWVLNTVVGISFLMSVGTCWLWVRSWERYDLVCWGRRVEVEGDDYVKVAEICSGKGAVEISWLKYQKFPARSDRPRNKVFFNELKYSMGPEDRHVFAGWRKSFWGFGVMHAYYDAQTKKMMELDRVYMKTAGMKKIPVNELESYQSVWVPHWFVAGSFAVWPVRRFYSWSRVRARKARGLCTGCGYDMRGGGERCPECGARNDTKIVHEVHQAHEGKM